MEDLNKHFGPEFDRDPVLHDIKEEYISYLNWARDASQAAREELLRIPHLSEESFTAALNDIDEVFNARLEKAHQHCVKRVNDYHKRVKDSQSRTGLFTKATAWVGGYKLFGKLFH